MTIREYEAITHVLSTYVLDNSLRALLALEIAYRLRAGNKDFDMDAWLKACRCGQSRVTN